jgi:hypothetical protein
MNKLSFTVFALIANISAVKLTYDDLPDTVEPEKVDPLSRYVNDEDLI